MADILATLTDERQRERRWRDQYGNANRGVVTLDIPGARAPAHEDPASPLARAWWKGRARRAVAAVVDFVRQALVAFILVEIAIAGGAMSQATYEAAGAPWS